MFVGMSKDGWFEGVKGFVFGRPMFYKGNDYKEVILDALKGYDVPKVFDADVGHKAPRMPFVNGARADVSVSSGACEIRYSFKRCPIRMRKRPNRTEYHPIRSLTYNRMRMDGRCSG